MCLTLKFFDINCAYYENKNIQSPFSKPILEKIFMCFSIFFSVCFSTAESYSVQRNSSKE